MQKKIIAVSIILALLVTAGMVTAQCKRGGTCPVGQAGQGKMGKGTMGQGMMAQRMIKELSLTQDQTQQLQQIRNEYMEATKATREQLKAEHQAMMSLWMADSPDAAAIKAEFAKIGDLKAQMRDTGVDYAIRGMAVLTADQRAKLKTMIQNKMGQCKEMGMGMGFGSEMGLDGID